MGWGWVQEKDDDGGENLHIVIPIPTRSIRPLFINSHWLTGGLLCNYSYRQEE